MKKNFAGQEFESGNKKIEVQDVAIWQKQQNSDCFRFIRDSQR
jgi:hypothetical protein